MAADPTTRGAKAGIMLRSLVHTYRGFLVEVGVGSQERYGDACYFGGYTIFDAAGKVAGYGKTPMATAHDIADRIALSMALDMVDRRLRSRLC